MSSAWSRGFEAAANGGEMETFRLALPLEELGDYEDGFMKGMEVWSLSDAWEQWEMRGNRDGPAADSGRGKNKNP